MHLHQVSSFGIVCSIEMGGFTNWYRSEGARGRQVIIVKGSRVIGSLISLSFSLALNFFLRMKHQSLHFMKRNKSIADF
jgi:hypothetical protein